MTPTNSDPRDEAEFEHRLRQLIHEARDRNTPFDGSYSVRSPDPDVQDYEVLITKLGNRLIASTA